MIIVAPVQGPNSRDKHQNMTPDNPSPEPTYHQFAAADVSDDVLNQLNGLRLAKRAESHPGDPQPSAEELLRELRAPAIKGFNVEWTLGSLDSQPVGYAVWDLESLDNPQQTWLDAFVLPDFRRQGLGGQLLSRALTGVEERFKPTMAGFAVPAHTAVGSQLIEHVEQAWGLKVGSVERMSRQILAESDLAAIEAELADRLARQEGAYSFLFFAMDEFPPPETGFSFESYLAACEEIFNLMPLEDIQVQPERVTPESYLTRVARQRARGRLTWHYAVLDRATQTCVGFTTINFNPSDPRLLEQWGTGVVKAAQGHGLGKTLKLLMLVKILQELPRAQFIDTGNAHSNAPMIAINTALGFREHFRLHVYQLEMARMRELVGGE